MQGELNPSPVLVCICCELIAVLVQSLRFVQNSLMMPPCSDEIACPVRPHWTAMEGCGDEFPSLSLCAIVSCYKSTPGNLFLCKGHSCWISVINPICLHPLGNGFL